VCGTEVPDLLDENRVVSDTPRTILRGPKFRSKNGKADGQTDRFLPPKCIMVGHDRKLRLKLKFP
jgi:hypothetical protein